MYVSFLSVGSCFSWMRVLRTHERAGWFPIICWMLFNDQSINSLYNKSRLLICLFFEFQHSIMIWAFWQGSRNLLMKVLFPKLFLDLNLWSSIRLCRQLKVITLVMPWMHSGLTKFTSFLDMKHLMFLVLILFLAKLEMIINRQF